jgi:hypothetical protein
MDDLKTLLKFDSLAEAEKITGESYKGDDATVGIGMLLMWDNNEKLEKILDAQDDTKFSETISEYLRKVTDFGFEILLKDTFKSTGWDDEEIEEQFYVMFHREYSILLAWDTFRGHRNGGKMYYNWSPNGEKYGLTSSGGTVGRAKREAFSSYFNADFTPFEQTEESMTIVNREPKWDLSTKTYEEYSKLSKLWDLDVYKFAQEHNLVRVWSGDHDCREAIKFNIKQLAENGTFLKKWVKPPFLWLLHHNDPKEPGYNYEEINNERISRLPKDVQEIIHGIEL